MERLKVTVEITSAAFGMDAIPKKRATNAATLMKSSKSSRKNKELAVKFEQMSEKLLDQLVKHLRSRIPTIKRLQYDSSSPPSTRTIII